MEGTTLAGPRRGSPLATPLALATRLLCGVLAAVLSTMVFAGPASASAPPPSPTDTTTPETTEPVRLVPVPTGCDAPEQPYLVFIGTLADTDYRTARFQIDQVRAGRTDPFVDGEMVDIRYGKDAQYLEVGATYLVGAGRDPALGILVSRVTPPVEDFGGDDVIGVSESDVDCEKAEDPVRTLYPDGTPIDGPVLQPIRGEWTAVMLSIAQPIAIALGVIFVLALLRNGTRAAARAVRADDRSM